MSCIYGPRQFGNEDQGWVAHFARSVLQGDTITIYGDGAQVRDVLHVDDAVNAYRALLAHIDEVKGEAFNLGGGCRNAVSLLELIDELRARASSSVSVEHGDWRTGDQPWFVADTSKLSARVHWRPEVDWREGLDDLINWLRTGVTSSCIAERTSATTDAAVLRRRSA